jgi:hypothetical protein
MIFFEALLLEEDRFGGDAALERRGKEILAFGD